MFSGIVFMMLIFCFVVFFIIYKRNMLIRMFSLKVEDHALQFQNQLQETGTVVIDRLEMQITHLEYLLEESDKRIEILNRQIQTIEGLLQNPLIQPSEIIGEAISSDKLPDNKQNSAEKLSGANLTENLDMEDKNRRQLVLGLAEQGYTITEIAKATSIGKGEIMLLLQLNKK
ncbi:MAG: hypothetical protein H6Q65_251 [Firmicutes bacterium]|nr:hypothetical protein [Bacillota bacterium]